MIFNRYVKKNVKLVSIVFFITVALVLATVFIRGSLEHRREDSRYAAYNNFCAENDLHFFDALASLPLGSDESITFGADISDSVLAELLNRDDLASIESRRVRLEEQIESLKNVTPPIGLIYVHQELIARLSYASRFDSILLSSVSSGLFSATEEPQHVSNFFLNNLSITAGDYFRSLDRMLLLIDIIPTGNLNKVPNCLGYGDGVTRRHAENYVTLYRAFFSSDDTLINDREFNPPILVSPKSGGEGL